MISNRGVMVTCTHVKRADAFVQRSSSIVENSNRRGEKGRCDGNNDTESHTPDSSAYDDFTWGSYRCHRVQSMCGASSPRIFS